MSNIRPDDPLLRLFQECLMMEPGGDPDDPQGRATRTRWIEDKARELSVEEEAVPYIRKVAGYVSSTPIAIIDVRRMLGFDLEENLPVEGIASFVVPAYGDFVEVIGSNLLADGYRRERDAEHRQGEVCFFSPETRIFVSLRLAKMYPRAQGPSGFIETVKAFGDVLGQTYGGSRGGDGSTEGTPDAPEDS